MLYSYCPAQISALATEVSFAPLSSRSISKGETLRTEILLVSKLNPVGVRCHITISGNTELIKSYTLGQDNSFILEIDTTRLNQGKYDVRLELLLKDSVPNIAYNPTSSFSLEVTPVSAMLMFAGDAIGEREQGLLLESVQQGIQKYRTPVNIIASGMQATSVSQSRYEFIITLMRTEYPSMIGYYVTFTFARDGEPLVKPPSREFKDTSIDFLFRRSIGGFIRDNQKFFQDVNVALSY
jgi:hypothetical protein